MPTHRLVERVTSSKPDDAYARFSGGECVWLLLVCLVLYRDFNYYMVCDEPTAVCGWLLSAYLYMTMNRHAYKQCRHEHSDTGTLGQKIFTQRL